MNIISGQLVVPNNTLTAFAQLTPSTSIANKLLAEQNDPITNYVCTLTVVHSVVMFTMGSAFMFFALLVGFCAAEMASPRGPGVHAFKWNNMRYGMVTIALPSFCGFILVVLAIGVMFDRDLK